MGFDTKTEHNTGYKMDISHAQEKSGQINSLLSFLPDIDEIIPYKILSQINPGLSLDIGAAAGVMTQKMLQANPYGRVLAFEPFAGNHPFFRQALQNYSNWQLVPKAAADFSGDGAFHVSSTVKGTEKNWLGMTGYSSVGFLVQVEKLSNYNQENIETVQVCKIDDHVSEPVRLMKIDVQGTEFNVLRGASNTIDQYGIDLIHTEFTGDIRLLNFLDERGYCIFDTDYMMIPLRNDPTPQKLGMTRHEIRNLSIGRQAFSGPVINRPSDFAGYCSFMAETIEKYGFWHTDLFCVHQNFLPQFLSALSEIYMQ